MGAYTCCRHCVDDPTFHKENPKDSHDVPCDTCQADVERQGAARALRDAAAAVAYAVDWGNAPESVESWLNARAEDIENGGQS